MDEAKCPGCGAEGKMGDTCTSCNVDMEEKCPNCGNAKKSKCECVMEEQEL